MRGYLWASTHLIPALINRFKERRYLKASDSKILNRCMLYYNNFKRNNFTHSTKKTILIITSFMIYPPTSGGKLRIYNICKRLSKEYNLILLSLIHNQDEEKYSLFLKQIFKEVHLIHPKTKSNEFLFPDRYKYSFSGLLIDKLIEIQDKKRLI